MGGKHKERCEVEIEQQTEYKNCWGEDIRGANAESMDDCCRLCAADNKCEVFTFDIWDQQGERNNYCFLKSNCSDPIYSPTAISGFVRRPSTTTTNKTTTSTTTTTTTSSKTSLTTTQPSTTGSGSTTPKQEPQCETPVAKSMLSTGQAKLINVSSSSECCASCTDNCTYVTYGKYKTAAPEQFACFLYADSPPEEMWMTGLLAIKDAEESSCDALGLSDCAGASVTFAPVPAHQFVGVWLPVTGVASFTVSGFLGVMFSQWIGLGNRLFKTTP